jgi:NADH-quinone oxidoreductase subunit N
MLLVLSMAGIPPLIGFLGKFNLFISALKTSGNPLGLILLVALALGASAVSLYYYLGMLKAAFCKDATQTGTIEANGYQISLIITTALITILLGVFPGTLLARFMEAFAS